jgi:predicted metal-dependent HD superfamily phosphohydrolase
MKSAENLVEKTASHVAALLRSSLPEWAVYHGLPHTIETVNICASLAADAHLTGNDLEVLLVAAWFHDTGYIEGPEGHEQRSVDRAREFMIDNGCSSGMIEEVASAIFSTKLPQTPRSEVEEILCDADVSHAGREDFFEKSVQLREEMEGRLGRVYTDGEWFRFNLAFLESHPFHTGQAKTRFSRQRSENIRILKGKLGQDA